MRKPRDDKQGDEAAARDVGRRYFALFNEVGIIAQLTRASFEAAQDDGLTLPQFTVLNHMVRLGDGASPLALARAFQIPKASLTNTLGRLERGGLVEARPNPEDGRGKLIYLTSAGRARREAAIDAMGGEMAGLVNAFPPEVVEKITPQLAELRRILDEMRD